MVSKVFWSLIFLLFILPGFAQSPIDQSWDAQSLNSLMRIIASDELQGRNTGELGQNIAASIIAEVFRKNNLQNLPGLDNYYQTIPFKRVRPGTGFLSFGNHRLEQGDSLVVFKGEATNTESEFVFVNHGISAEDYNGKDVAGKYVIGIVGNGETRSPFQAMQMIDQKLEIAKSQGALGMVDIYTMNTPWNFISRFANRPRLVIDESTKGGQRSLFYAMISLDQESIGKITSQEGFKGTLDHSGINSEAVEAKNVLGWLEGTDPDLKNEFILLSAHYDHVGTKSSNGDIEQDTIFNGARDNGIGILAVLAAAEQLNMHRPKRSVIFALWTAEEIGLLGSKYFVDNPPISLESIRYNLNSDGAGYSDTSVVSVMGYDRVGTANEMKKACDAYNLGIVIDPAAEQNLFDRSDNVRFADKGIPAPTFSPGFRAFDEEIRKNYHQVTDNPETLDYQYLNRFWKAFTYSAYLIGNMESAPKWIADDKYEPAAKKLYGDRYD